jgi:quinol monooxygenase YgiN
MYIVVVHHWCKPDMVEAARKRIDTNGAAMAKAPGFHYRCRMEPGSDPLQVSTITAWTDEAAYRAHRGQRPPLNFADPAFPFTKVENSGFIVQTALGDLRAA